MELAPLAQSKANRIPMKDLVEYIAKGLVDNPNEVTVNEIHAGNNTILELHVSPDDMGRVIGREGKVANAIRSLVRVAGARQRLRINVEIVE
jgi:predicted RNA-binding protein YlqC (UPF0109 family)